MDKVLILGAHGMLGQALVRAFNAPKNPPLRIRGGEGELLAWDREECDITDAALVAKKIGELQPTIIINAAAYNDVDEAETSSELANRVNGDAVGYLAEAAAAVGATFVHYSTDYVFDGTKKEGYREDDVPNPISAYGKSKFLGEQRFLLSLRAKVFPLLAGEGRPPKASLAMGGVRFERRAYLIRTSRLFGKQGSGKQSFVDLMLERSRAQETIEVIDEELSSPTYADDLAHATCSLIEAKNPSGIYHLTNSGACTWYGFAQEIFSATGGSLLKDGQAASDGKLPMIKPVLTSHFPRSASRPAYSQLLNTKLPQLRSWHEALREYLKSLPSIV